MIELSYSWEIMYTTSYILAGFGSEFEIIAESFYFAEQIND